MESNALPNRKRPVHLETEWALKNEVQFVTVCTRSRKAILANDQADSCLTDSWRASPSWLVGRYVVMPDHVHLFCCPGTPDPPPLAKWVAFWKSLVARRWFEPAQNPVRQEGFWDTRMRSAKHYDDRWRYDRIQSERVW